MEECRGSSERALNPKAEVTLHQGAIESIFLDSLHHMGRTVERPVKPTSVELSQNEAELGDPRAYPVKVRRPNVPAHRCTHLRQIGSEPGPPETTQRHR